LYDNEVPDKSDKSDKSENQCFRCTSYDRIQPRMIKDVTDLDIYNQSLKLLPRLYLLLRKLPISEKDLILQSKRAAKSVSANIAEGFAKRYFEKEFKRYLMIALASNDEVISHLRTLIIVKPVLTIETMEVLEEYKTLSKRINVLHKKWRFGSNSDTLNH
jgi:four helix bundle protein